MSNTAYMSMKLDLMTSCRYLRIQEEIKSHKNEIYYLKSTLKRRMLLGKLIVNLQIKYSEKKIEELKQELLKIKTGE